MSDDGFDPCECTWSHEMAMRRLLSLSEPVEISRNSPSSCFTIFDNASTLIIDPTGWRLPGSLPGPQNESNGFMMMAMCWMALALAIFFLRPNTLRAIDDSKPRNNGPVCTLASRYISPLLQQKRVKHNLDYGSHAWPKRCSPYTSTGNKLNKLMVDTSRL
uniref:Small integral membrane protein 14 n=1 Tax=Timema bartmani TaxID=61472 RepID=A0A7R9I4V3_9NEOP|nr:unnamed protein product [Timema bartmani]